MTYLITVTSAFPVDELRLQQAVSTVLDLYDCLPGSGVSIEVVDNETIQQLNRDFREVDAPTDVLSFPADLPPLPEMLETEEALYVGDLAIAYPYTSAQAERLGHDLSDSLVLLVVHGTLHLLGYDHDTLENKTIMWQEQAKILEKVNVPLSIVPALESPDE